MTRRPPSAYDALIGVLGHDLQNPLSAIMTAASLLELRADSEKISAPVSRILLSADRMERMISQLLDFTRIHLGTGLSIDRARVDLAEVARVIVDELDPVTRCYVDLELVGDAVGDWDRDRFGQLLSSLIANACRHGSPEALVRVRLDGTQPEAVRLKVTNQGAIPSDLIALLFEPFREARKRGTERGGPSGLGLGLYIAQQIVAAHGGTIEVESNAATGTCFSVGLPRFNAGSPALDSTEIPMKRGPP